MARCACTTKKGTRCSNTAKPGRKYCSTHLRFECKVDYTAGGSRVKKGAAKSSSKQFFDTYKEVPGAGYEGVKKLPWKNSKGYTSKYVEMGSKNRIVGQIFEISPNGQEYSFIDVQLSIAKSEFLKNYKEYDFRGPFRSGSVNLEDAEFASKLIDFAIKRAKKFKVQEKKMQSILSKRK